MSEPGKGLQMGRRQKPKLVRKRIGKDNPLCLAIVGRGFSHKVAPKIVNLIFDEIKAALARHEVVELPFGTLRVIAETHREGRRWRFGQPQAVFTKRFRVAFESSGETFDVSD